MKRKCGNANSKSSKRPLVSSDEATLSRSCPNGIVQSSLGDFNYANFDSGMETETPRAAANVSDWQPDVGKQGAANGKMEFCPDALRKMIISIVRDLSEEAGGIKMKPSSDHGIPSDNQKSNASLFQPHGERIHKGNSKVLLQDPQKREHELKAALSVIKKIMKMDAAEPFSVPVDPIALRIPDYFEVIDTPMDFGTICNNLEKGLKYMNSEGVYMDVQYIWENCCTYNKKGDCILELMDGVRKIFTAYWTAAGLYTEPMEGDDGYSSLPPPSESSMRHSTRRQGCLVVPVTDKVGQSAVDPCTRALLFKQPQLSSSQQQPSLLHQDMNAGTTAQLQQIGQQIQSEGYNDDIPIAKIKSKKDSHQLKSIKLPLKALVAKRAKVKHDGSHKLTRHAPQLLTDVVKRLSKNQRKWVRATGLGSLLDFNIDQYDHKLGFVVVANFNVVNNEIAFPCGTISVLDVDVEQILGLPCGKSPVVLGRKGESTPNEDIFRGEFQDVGKSCNIGLIELCQRIKGIREVSHVFKLFFLVIVNNMVIKKNANMYANQTFLRFMGDIDKLYNYNLCAYLLEALRSEKTEWAKDPKNKCFNGSLAFLTLLYVECTHLIGLPPTPSESTTLQRWTHITLTERFDAELNRGPFATEIAVMERCVVSKKRNFQKMILSSKDQEVELISTGNEADWAIVAIEKVDMVAKLQECADDVLRKLSELKEARRRYDEMLATCEIGDQRVNDIHATVIHEDFLSTYHKSPTNQEQQQQQQHIPTLHRL